MSFKGKLHFPPPQNQNSTHKQLYEKYLNNKKYKEKFAKTISLAYDLIEEHFPGVSISAYGRIKSSKSFDKKSEKKDSEGKPVFVYDIYAFKVIITDVSDSYTTNNPKIIDAKNLLNATTKQYEDSKKMLEIAKERDLVYFENLKNSTKYLTDSKENYQVIKTQTSTIEAQLSDLEEECMSLYKKNNDMLQDFKKTQDTIDVNFLTEFSNYTDEQLSSLTEQINNMKINLEDSKKNMESAKLALTHANYEFETSKINYSNNTTDLEKFNTNLKSLEEIMNSQKDIVNVNVAEEIADFLTADDSPFLTKLNATNNKDRIRNYNKENGYIANQRTINIDDINIEIQFRSSYRNDLAKENHNDLENKQKILPIEEILNCKTKKDFENLMINIPTYIATTNERKTKQASPYLNFIHYYSDLLFELRTDEDDNLITNENNNSIYVHQDVLDKLNEMVESDDFPLFNYNTETLFPNSNTKESEFTK